MANTKPKTAEEELQEILDNHRISDGLKVVGAIMLLQIIPCVVIVPLIWIFSDFIFPIAFSVITFIPWLAQALKDGANTN